MNHIFRIIPFIALIAFLVLCLETIAQPYKNREIPELEIKKQSIEFDHLYFEDENDYYSVEDIATDPYGFIWFATKDGLFRYDGMKFFHVQQRLTNQKHNLSDEILALTVGKDTVMWLLSPEAIYCLNLKNFDIQIFPVKFGPKTNIGNIIRGDIFNAGDSVLYAGYWGGGFLELNLQTRQVNHYFFDPDSFPVPSNTVTCILRRNKNSFWIGTHDGLFVFKSDKKRFEKFNIQYKAIDNKSISPKINALTKSTDGYLWLGTNKGLVRLNPINRKTVNYHLGKSPLDNYESNIVESLAFNQREKLWIASRYGIYRFDPITEKYTGYFHDKYYRKSLQSNYSRKVYTDNNNILWIGHHGGTISKYAPRKKQFSAYTLHSDFVGDLRVFSLFKEKQTIWFGTETGLYKYNRTNKTLFRYTNIPGDTTSLSHNFVSGIKKDKRGFFWIATDKGGLNRFNAETGKFTNVLQGSNELASYSISDIWSIVLGKNNTIWCGTGGSGLLAVNINTNTIKSFTNNSGNSKGLSENFIGPIVETGSGMLWVGTANKGLNFFNPLTDTASHFIHNPKNNKSLISNTIKALYLTSDKKLWIGTARGISILNTENFTINNAIAKQLENISIEAILESANGNMWFSSEKGLFKYDKSTGSIKRYLQSDGISNNRFISGSCFKSKDGELFFGSVQGFTCFYPWSIKDNEHKPPVYITDIKLFDKSLMFSDEYQKQFLDKKITFHYKQNNLSFLFAGLDFYDPDKNQYIYKLENFDNKWNKLHYGNQANYNNLQPGRYKFIVKASNNDNVWNRKGDYVNIVIKPPFWETFAFRISLLIIIVVGVYTLINMRLRNIKKQKEELEILVAARTQEVNKQKNNIEKKHHALEKQKTAIEHQAIQLATINKKLEEQQTEIRKQAEELREMNRLKSRFFANISHEFRTPLTLILNSIFELKKTHKTDKEQKNVQSLERNAHRLLRLIDQLLDLTKIESGFMGLSVSQGNMQRFMQAIVDAFTLKAQASDIAFHTSINPEIQTIYADWDKLEKIFYNLLSNAFKFTEKGGTVKLSIDFSENHNKLKIMVEDTGCGIPEPLHEKIFSRFYRNEASNLHYTPGTGIGLALTRQLTKIHKGKIQLESAPGKGSTFTVVIPFSKDAFLDDEISKQKHTDFEHLQTGIMITEFPAGEILNDKQDAQNNSKSKKARLLFIDDNTELCRQVKNYFSDFFDVIIAFNGQDGFNKAIDELPDIIVSDLMMPKISGIDLCQKLKEDIRTDHLAFILLTAKKDEHSQMQALNIGADDYITKPFSMNALAIKIRNQLNTRKMLEQKLLKEFVDSKHFTGKKFSNSFLNKAIQIIEKNTGNLQFGINDLARELNLSRTQLYRKLNSLISIPVNEFIKDVKLKKAHQLLTTGEFNISEVAVKCGFNTPGYFSRCFEQKYGILPSKFLRQQKRK